MTIALTLAISPAAWEEGCPYTSPINLNRDEPFDLEVFFDNTLAVATSVQLYAGDKLVHSVKTDSSGRVRLGLLPHGNYRVVLPSKAMLYVVVLPSKIQVQVG